MHNFFTILIIPSTVGIAAFSKLGEKNYFKLPEPIINKAGCYLSFAGLKTAVLKISKTIKSDQEKYNLAASFQKIIEEILCKKSKVAFKEFKKSSNSKKNTFVIAGGVASNKNIRQKLIELSLKEKFDPIFPPINLCSDNAAMIAMVGLEKYKLGLYDNLDFPARPRWPLDEKAVFLKGAGVRL